MEQLGLVWDRHQCEMLVPQAAATLTSSESLVIEDKQGHLGLRKVRFQCQMEIPSESHPKNVPPELWVGSPGADGQSPLVLGLWTRHVSYSCDGGVGLSMCPVPELQFVH